MKKQFVLFIAAAVVSISSLMAQDKGRIRQTPEDRTKVTMAKLADFNLSPDVKSQAEAVFNTFYKAQQEFMREARDAGNTDRTVTMAKRQQLVSERDGKLKEILSEEQYSKWINDIEPSMKPQRPAKTDAVKPASTATPAAPVSPVN